jgi:lysophospholipase L1-like esterase
MPRIAELSPGRMIAVALTAVTLTGCGGAASSSDRHRDPGRLSLDDIGRTGGCTGYGHSGIEGYGVEPDQAFLSLVCRKFTGTVDNLGIGGSTLQGQLAEILGSMPPDHARQLSVVMWGLNDLALFGPQLGGYKAGLRMLISRLRSPPVDVHGADDRQLHYAGSWSKAFGERVTSTDGASFSWTSQRGFRGGTVAFTGTFRQGLGARYTFTLDGHPAGVWDTRGLAPPPPAPPVNTPGAFRIKVPRGSGHTVRCVISDITGGANVLGWQLEAAKPPLIVLVEHPLPPNFDIYNAGGWHFHPNDSQVLELDDAMRSVAAEFDSYVLPVDPQSEIDSQARYFLSDGTHFSVSGNQQIAHVIEHAIEHDPHARISR